MKNDILKKGLYEENPYLTSSNKIILNRDKNNPFSNGLIFGKPSSGASVMELSQIKKDFKDIERKNSDKQDSERGKKK